MTWRVIEEVKSEPANGKRYRIPSMSGYQGHKAAWGTMAFVVWKCDGCGFLACSGGDTPGPCGNVKCRFSGR